MPSLRASLPPRERVHDLSNIGTVGRRTGTTLALRKLDENGLEEVSGLFSSPKKPSPVKRSTDVVESVEQEIGGVTPLFRYIEPIGTPATNMSAPRSVHRMSNTRLRSASPKKSGISGIARRSNAVGAISQTPQAVGLRASSARPATVTRRRFSPDTTPLSNRALRGSKTTQAVRISDIQPAVVDDAVLNEEENTPTRIHLESKGELTIHQNDQVEIMGDVEPEQSSVVVNPTEEDNVQELGSLASEDDEDEDETFEPPEENHTRHNEPAAANSRRKRRSSAIEDIHQMIPSPAIKKRKKNITTSIESPATPGKSSQTSQRNGQQSKAIAAPNPRGRPPLQNKSNNIKLSAKERGQLTEVVDKIRARPGGAARTLHLLRRETPSDDTVLRTRTGRLSIKPLAYWRNEKVVFTNTEDEACTGLADGGRFPLNTVRYVHRIDETIVQPEKRRNAAKKGRTNKRAGTRKVQVEDEESESDSEFQNNDPDSEEWELDPGTIAGEIALWDSEHQVHANMTETVEIAHSSGAIETNEVKGSTFRFAKLLSTPFFGTGIVDLPPGGVKKVKNSRKMHMTFFVCTGRVTVDVGPPGGQETRFSIGKGGYWQVPRGNNYAILNENGKDARLFFSQACEVPVMASDE